MFGCACPVRTNQALRGRVGYRRYHTTASILNAALGESQLASAKSARATGKPARAILRQAVEDTEILTFVDCLDLWAVVMVEAVLRDAELHRRSRSSGLL